MWQTLIATRGLFAGLAAISLLAPVTAAAQGVRPSEQPLRVPDLAPGTPSPDPLALPPLPELEPGDRGSLESGLQVYVAAFEIVGSTVFTPDELALVVAPYVGRTITSEELLAARDAVTGLYIANGYVTSGAVIPDQDVADDVVRLEIVEGRLGEIVVEGSDHFRASYFERRLGGAGRAPVSLERIEAQLQRFQLDPLIARVHAALEPGARLGESRLILRVEEARQYSLAIGTANDRSPAVGSTGGIVWADYANLIGYRDTLALRAEVTAGLWEVNLGWEIPITRWDTRLGFGYRRTGSEIVESPFDTLDIEASSQTFGVSLLQPVWRTAQDDVWLGLIFEWRQSDATLLGMPFCFQPDTTVCDPVVVPLRLLAEWTHRTSHDVVAARSLLTFGLDALGATIATAGAPDGRFIAWLGQMQWVHVLPESALDSQLVVRGSGQFANGSLLSIERFSVGGFSSVRGYRENQLVTDNGVIGSVEVRIPVWRDALGRHRLQLVPFVDVGHAWNHTSPEPPEETLASAGVGLRMQATEWARGEFFWGQRLIEVPNPKTSAQDYGIYFQVVIDVF